MKIKIKTNLIEIEVEDEPKIGSDNYTKRAVPELITSLQQSIEQAIKLHNEVLKGRL